MPQEALPVFSGAMSRTEHQKVIIKMHRRQVKMPYHFFESAKKSADTAASTTKL